MGSDQRNQRTKIVSLFNGCIKWTLTKKSETLSKQRPFREMLLSQLHQKCRLLQWPMISKTSHVIIWTKRICEKWRERTSAQITLNKQTRYISNLIIISVLLRLSVKLFQLYRCLYFVFHIQATN